VEYLVSFYRVSVRVNMLSDADAAIVATA